MKTLLRICVALTLTAIVFFVPAAWPAGSDHASTAPSFFRQLHAATAQANADVVFFPVGNQEVRKFVFWDRSTNQIHIYSGGGKFEETWQLVALGQNLRRQ